MRRTMSSIVTSQNFGNRHQMASLMVQGGCILYEVQHVLGHASPAVTQRYAHLSSKSLAAVSNTASLAIQRAMAAGQGI